MADIIEEITKEAREKFGRYANIKLEIDAPTSAYELTIWTGGESVIIKADLLLDLWSKLKKLPDSTHTTPPTPPHG